MNTNGEIISADPHGNNLAVTCSSCGQEYFLDIREHKEVLYVQTKKEAKKREKKGRGRSFFLRNA